MLLADRGYDADWIRAFVNEQGAWANVPPRFNRGKPICFSPHLYRARNSSRAILQQNQAVSGDAMSLQTRQRIHLRVIQGPGQARLTSPAS